MCRTRTIRWGKGLILRSADQLQKECETAAEPRQSPKEYRNETAIAIVELCNENALYVGFRAPTPAYDQELSDLYNTWLKQKRRSQDLIALRTLAGVPAGQSIPRLAGREAGSAPRERVDTEIQFFNEMESAFFTGMRAYLRHTLGVTATISATADYSHSGSGYPLLRSASLMDIVDGHTYWQHPGAGSHSADGERARAKYRGGTFADRVRRQTLYGQRSEPSIPQRVWFGGIPALAAYAPRCRIGTASSGTPSEPKVAADWKPYVGDPFDISLDPVKMPQLAAGR